MGLIKNSTGIRIIKEMSSAAKCGFTIVLTDNPYVDKSTVLI